MARLFDELVADDRFSELFSGELPPNTICIDANNVIRYYYELSPKDEWHTVKDFPNIAPPFNSFFIEGNTPKRANVNGTLVTLNGSGKMGALFTSKEIESLSKIERKQLDALNNKVGANFLNNSKWIINTSLAYKINNNKIEIIAQIIYGVTESGLYATDDNGMCPKIAFINKMLKHNNAVASDFVGLFHPFWLTLCFLHCKKQTKLTEHTPPEKVQKKRLLRNRQPLVKYYTLDIEPLKTILRTEGRVNEVGLPKALHICRGHFKDYSQGKGLFGKYKGLYWWDNHIRGNEEVGTIVKNYAVKLPQDTAMSK